MTEEYHTALHADGRADRPEMWRWKKGHNEAFVHDVSLGIPEEMARADMLYAELPWKDGYREFLSRVHQPLGIALSYERWLYRLSVSLALFGKPFVVVAGHAASRHLAYEWSRPVDLNGSLALAMGAGCKDMPGIKTATGLRVALACSVDCIGDFCAGFGAIARAAEAARCHWICSDINPRYIGTIAEWAEAAA